MKKIIIILISGIYILNSCNKEEDKLVDDPKVKPTADFIASKTSVIKGEEIFFSDKSTNSPTNWTWNFGDGAASDIKHSQNPSHSYEFLGVFSISLTAQNQYGLDEKIREDYVVVKDGNGGCVGCKSGTFTDNRDGKVYKWVQILDQIWMAENLAYLPSVNTPTDGSVTEPRYYVYGFIGTNISAAKESDNYLKYGVLYNWKAATAGSNGSSSNPSGVRGICPDGWHLPSDDEWKQFEMALGMDKEDADASGQRLIQGQLMAKTEGGTNSSKFSALYGGYRHESATHLRELGKGCYFWSTTDQPSGTVWYRKFGGLGSYRALSPKSHGYSIRCVKDK